MFKKIEGVIKNSLNRKLNHKTHLEDRLDYHSKNNNSLFLNSNSVNISLSQTNNANTLNTLNNSKTTKYQFSKLPKTSVLNENSNNIKNKNNNNNNKSKALEMEIDKTSVLINLDNFYNNHNNSKNSNNNNNNNNSTFKTSLPNLHSSISKKSYPFHPKIWHKKDYQTIKNSSLNPLGPRTGVVVDKEKALKDLSIKKTEYSVLASLNNPYIAKGYNFSPERYEKYHPGRWFFHDIDQINCWSCCLNEDEKNQGCVKKVISGGSAMLD